MKFWQANVIIAVGMLAAFQCWRWRVAIEDEQDRKFEARCVAHGGEDRSYLSDRRRICLKGGYLETENR